MWPQVASERETTTAAQKGATGLRWAGGAQSTAQLQEVLVKMLSPCPPMSTHDPRVDMIAVVELQEEAALDVLEGQLNDQ